MSFQPQKPTELDLKNYSYACKDSPFYENPGKFLKMGQRVRAKFRIWDTPQKTIDDPRGWGWVSAEAGEVGTVVHVQDGLWPTVQFDDTGCSTCVTDFEVEPIDNQLQDRAYAEFFQGLAFKFYHQADDVRWMANVMGPYETGIEVAEAYIKDVQSGAMPGISISDMVKVALRNLKY